MQISKKNPERRDSLLEHQEWLYSTKTVYCGDPLDEDLKRKLQTLFVDLKIHF
jgi:hypothetical protein